MAAIAAIPSVDAGFIGPIWNSSSKSRRNMLHTKLTFSDEGDNLDANSRQDTNSEKIYCTEIISVQ
jgi:hypothetical protein